jgi:CheY-like chemotaxis protein
MRLLLADDDPSLRQLFAAYLRRQGWDVMEAGNSHEAVAVATSARNEGRPAALFVCDLSMPGPKGADLVRAFRRAGCHQPVLIMTGYAEEEVLARIQEVGCRHILAKPFSREALCAKIAEVLRAETPCA